MTKQNIRSANALQTDTISPTTGNRLFAERVTDIYTILEALLGEDGLKPRITKITFLNYLYSGAPFTARPVIVQTAGSFSDTVDINSYQEQDALDSAIDDVFGYQNLAHVRQGRQVPNDGAVQWSLYFSTDLPQHLIQLINKELETERLQELLLGYVGRSSSNVTISYYNWMIIDFVGVRKSIIIR